MIINKMIDENQYQGRLYNYLIPHENLGGKNSAKIVYY